MERHFKTIAVYILSGVAALTGSLEVRAQTLPYDFTVEGRLYTAAGAPLSTTTGYLRLELLSEVDTSCVLFREDFAAIDIAGAGPGTPSEGVFALRLGSGSKVFPTGAISLPVLFKAGSHSGNNDDTTTANCTSVATASHHPLVRVRFKTSIGGSFETLSPDTRVTAVPTAMVADSANTLQGKDSTAFILTNTSSSLVQTNVDNVFSSTNYAKLLNLLSGAAYIPATPTAPVAFNNQRLTGIADPTGAQDAATKNYADAFIGGKTIDSAGVGLGVGGGKTLVWDQILNKWVAQTISAGVSGVVAGSGLLGGTITSVGTLSVDVGTTGNQIVQLSGGKLPAVDGSSLTNIQFPVISVNGKTGVAGAVTLIPSDIVGFGTASTRNVGTNAGHVLEFLTNNQLPALDGSLLSSISAQYLRTRLVASTAPSAGQVLTWNGSQWEPQAAAVSGITDLYGDVTAIGPGNVNAIIGNDKITSAKISTTGNVANRILITDATTGANVTYATCLTGEILKYNVGTGWGCSPDATGSGTLTYVAAGAGLIGGPITTAGTISVDVGINANQILQLTAAAQIPSVDAYLLSNLNPNSMSSGTISDARLSSNIANKTYVDSHSVAGDISGTLAGATVDKIKGLSISAALPTAGQVLTWNGSQWQPDAVASAANTFVNGGNSFAAIANLGTNDLQPLNILTNSLPRITVLQAGNVGIGTTTPIGRLEVVAQSTTGVAQSAVFRSNFGGVGTNNENSVTLDIVNGNGSNNNNITFRTDNVWQWELGTDWTASGGGDFYLMNPGMKGIFIDSSGHTGLSIANPQSGLDVVNASLGTYAGATAAPTNGLIVSGMVGVGTTAPSAQLQVTPSTVTTVGEIVKGRAGQTADLQQWVDSAGLVLANINAAGVISGNGSGLTGISGTISGLTASRIVLSNTATSVTDSANLSFTSATGMMSLAGASPTVTSTGGLTLTSSSASGAINIAPGSSTGTIVVGNATTTGAATIGNYGGGAQTTLRGGSGASGRTIVTSAGTSATAVNITVTGTNGGITLTPNGTGMVNVGGVLSVSGGIENSATTLSGFGSQGAPAFSFIGDTLTGMFEDTGGASWDLGFSVNGSEALRIREGGAVGIGTQVTKAILDVNATDSMSAIIVPRATTANRPGANAMNGMIRYNTNTNRLEGYENGQWGNISAATSGANAFVRGGNAFGSAAPLGTTDSQDLNLITSGSTRLTITNLGNVGIGSTIPTAKLDVAGTLKATSFIGATSSTSNSITNSYTINTDSDVAGADGGINLQVGGSNALQVGSTGDVLINNMTGSSSPSTGALKVNGGLGVMGNINVGANITSLGSVGIGTASPQASLHVLTSSVASVRGIVLDQYAPSIHGPPLQFRRARGTPGAELAIQSGDYIGGITSFGYDGATYGLGTQINFVATTNFTGANRDSDIMFQTVSGTTGSEKMRITSTGKVGIGTTSPTYPLNIYDSADNVGLQVEAPNVALIKLLRGGGIGATISAAVSGDTRIDAGLNGTDIYISGGSGKVGIGTTVPVALLDLSSTATSGPKFSLSRKNSIVTATDTIGTLQFWNNDSNLTTQNLYGSIEVRAAQTINTDAAAGDMIFSTTSSSLGGSPVERMRVDSNGNVGVGTTAPNGLLHVYGGTASTSANGTPIRLIAQSGGAGNTNGGDVVITAGASAGSGIKGQVQISGNSAFAGNVTQAPFAAGGASTLDFDNGNVQTTSFACGGPFTFNNLRNGGSYTIVVTDTGSSVCTFPGTVTVDGGSIGITYKWMPANSARTVSTETIYNLIRVGSVVYVTWTTGFN